MVHVAPWVLRHVVYLACHLHAVALLDAGDGQKLATCRV